MGSRAEHTQPTATELAELSALADGTLDPARRAEVQARIQASPELTALYERERHVVDALHQARATERAPARLRASIDASRPSRGTAARRRFAYAGAVAGALAAIVLALVLALPSGTPGGPSVSDAAALAARGPTQAAPVPDPADPGPAHQAPRRRLLPELGHAVRLESRRGPHRHPRRPPRGHGLLQVEGRHDRLHDRRSPPLGQPSAKAINWGGTELRTFEVNGRLVVTWRRAGDTCVLSGTGVTAAELQKLAAWKVPPDSD